MKVTSCLLAIIGCCLAEPDSLGIVGGQNTTITKFPWIVSMQYYNEHRCAASIISPTRFISAAHCTYNIPASDIQLRAGSSFTEKEGQLVQVSKVVNHRRYDLERYNYDISILWIEVPLNMALPGVSAIHLPVQGATVKPGELALVAGWGALWVGGPVPEILNYVAVPIVSNEQCNATYVDIISEITDGMLCAGLQEGGRDSCQGDSGGPLNIGDTLVGIVSWGKGCARPKYPGVYTRVAFYRNWIDRNI